jgi:hypothetical protein
MKMKDEEKKEKKHWVNGNVKMFNGEMEWFKKKIEEK